MDTQKIFEQYKTVCMDIIHGKISPQQASELIRRYLVSIECSNKKLPSSATRETMISMPVAFARNWRQWIGMKGDIGHPAFKLYRAGRLGKPRDWVARCEQFRGERGVYLTCNPNEPMIALSNSTVWERLSVFGVPYPPYDWDSSMRLMPVSLEACIETYQIIDTESTTLGEIEADGFDLSNHQYFQESMEYLVRSSLKMFPTFADIDN